MHVFSYDGKINRLISSLMHIRVEVESSQIRWMQHGQWRDILKNHKQMQSIKV